MKSTEPVEDLVVRRWLMRTVMVVLLLSLSNAARAVGQNAPTAPEVRAAQTGITIQLWTSNKIVNRGDRMHVWFSTNQNAFVAVLRVDTDGRVRMLYPERPWHNNYVQAGRLLDVQNPVCDDADCAFVIDDYPGKGYVFAISSKEPFQLDAFVNGDYWDYRSIAHRGRFTGDPFVALSTLMNSIVSHSSENEFSYDVYPYDVGYQFEFPRFLCYECHSHVRYPAWDPYKSSCTRFQIVRYDEPAYYPAGRFGDPRTVFARPQVLEARYVLRNRNPDEPFFSIGGTRPGRSTDAGATAADVGGVGAIPAPLGRGGTAADTVRDRPTLLERALRDWRGSSARAETGNARQQPQLRRRVATKPDSFGKPLSRPRVHTTLRRTRPDTSATRAA